MKKINRFILLIILSVITLTLTSCSEKEGRHFNFVLANATVPPLMATLDLWDSEDDTVMWFGRADTFNDVQALGERFELIQGAGEIQGQGINPRVISEMSNRVRSLYRRNRNNTFTLYVTDYGIRAPLLIFHANRIPTSNFNVVLLEDGTGTYNRFETLLNHEEGIDYFYDVVNEVDDMINQATNRTLRFASNIGNMDDLWHQTLVYGMQDNVELLMQFPNLVTTQNYELEKYLYSSDYPGSFNFRTSTLSHLFNSLSEENQDSYRNMLFDTTLLDEILRPDNGKETLIFAGTSFGGEELGFDYYPDNLFHSQFEVVMNDVIRMFGSTHNIVFSGHPAWPTEVGVPPINWQNQDKMDELLRRQAFFENNPDISKLPAQAPTDLVLIMYPEVFVGGYNSTLYMNAANDGQVKFFVTDNNEVDALSNIIATLFNDGFFTNSITGREPFFITPSNIGTAPTFDTLFAPTITQGWRV